MASASEALAQVTGPQFALFLLAAFAPPLLYLLVVRNSERYGRERWGRILGVFAHGAVIGVLVAWLGSALVIVALNAWVPGFFTVFVGTVMVAPVVEELAKGLGLVSARRHIRGPADGVVFAMASGLGFAATENLLYGSIAYASGGMGAWVTLSIGRAISSALVHPAACASIGYALGRTRQGASRLLLIPAYVVAVAVHAVYNHLVSYFPVVHWAGLVIPVGYPLAIGLALAVFLGFTLIIHHESSCEVPVAPRAAP